MYMCHVKGELWYVCWLQRFTRLALFISFLLLDLYVLEDDTSIIKVSFLNHI